MILKSMLAIPAALGLVAAIAPGPARAADGKTIVEEKCTTCHAVTAPAEPTLDNRLNRKGPPLFYAGDKFRREWLAEWLQAPERLRPAGDYYGHHVKDGPEGDEIDGATLAQHMALDKAEAEAVADHLMTLSAKADLLATDYEPKSISKRMGMLNFGKFKGCSSCHSDEDGYGGASGPELYTAFNRLKPGYIVSYVLDPKAWNPYSLMPNQHLNPEDAHKLADYLKVIAEEQK